MFRRVRKKVRGPGEIGSTGAESAGVCCRGAQGVWERVFEDGSAGSGVFRSYVHLLRKLLVFYRAKGESEQNGSSGAGECSHRWKSL